MNGPNRRDQAKEDFWRSAIARQKRSKLSQAEFCQKEGLNSNTFCSWKKTIQSRDQESRVRGPRHQSTPTKQEPDVPFVPMIVAGSQSPQSEGDKRKLVAELKFGGGRVSIFSGADLPTLTALLAAFKECFS